MFLPAIPALQAIVQDLFVVRASNKPTDANKDMETQREVLISMLLRLIHHHQVSASFFKRFTLPYSTVHIHILSLRPSIQYTDRRPKTQWLDNFAANTHTPSPGIKHKQWSYPTHKSQPSPYLCPTHKPTNANKDMETQREVLISILLRLIHHHQVCAK